VQAELELFQRWLQSLEVMPVIVGLRDKADEIVARVLSENEGRWEAMSEEDRRRVETLARTIVGRMLHEPTLRLKEIAGSDESFEVLATVRGLFGLDSGTDPGDGEVATVTPIRREGNS
ncbi:MAG TPA: glutamyl-tRNA reductase, partial [Solirubrobacterales bacterium]|nr:glutamyl-tRNA reductase [Solirubrobacterales bacterium]